MSVRRSIVVLLIITLLFPAVVFSVRANREAQLETTSNYQTTVVTRGTVEVTVTALGTIEADQTIELSFVLPGRVRDVYVKSGDVVRSGDILARQTDETQQLAVQQAQLNVDLAVMQRDQLLAGPDEGQILIAEANVDAAAGALYAAQNSVSSQDLQAAQLSYEAAQQALLDAQQARATAAGGQSDAAYALLDARVGEASFNVEVARLQLENAQIAAQPQIGTAYARWQQAQRELERVQAGATQRQLDAANAQIAQAQLQLEQAQRALRRTELVAPFDGIIAELNLEMGTIATPGLPALSILDIDPLRLTVQVDEIDVRQVREGLPARVRLDALIDEVFPAVLQNIAVISTNEAGIVSYDVGVELLAINDARVRVGMTAEASVIVEERNDVLIVPNLYIRLDRATGRAFVNVLKADGTLEEVEITLGLQGADVSEITAGLSEGDIVAVDLSADNISLFGG